MCQRRKTSSRWPSALAISGLACCFPAELSSLPSFLLDPQNRQILQDCRPAPSFTAVLWAQLRPVTWLTAQARAGRHQAAQGSFSPSVWLLLQGRAVSANQLSLQPQRCCRKLQAENWRRQPSPHLQLLSVGTPEASLLVLGSGISQLLTEGGKTPVLQASDPGDTLPRSDSVSTS